MFSPVPEIRDLFISQDLLQIGSSLGSGRAILRILNDVEVGFDFIVSENRVSIKSLLISISSLSIELSNASHSLSKNSLSSSDTTISVSKELFSFG
jgi:hypothetical protein